MTTPTPNQTKALTLLEAQTEEIKYLVDSISQLLDLVKPLTETLVRIQDAVSRPPAPAANSQANQDGIYRPITLTEIVMTYDEKGRAAYRGKGDTYQRYGIRIWPEMLAGLDVNPSTLKPGPNPVPNISALIEMHHVTDPATGEQAWKPRKIVSRQGAQPQQPPAPTPAASTEDIPF